MKMTEFAVSRFKIGTEKHRGEWRDESKEFGFVATSRVRRRLSPEKRY
jgi:hypothetical protein